MPVKGAERGQGPGVAPLRSTLEGRETINPAGWGWGEPFSPGRDHAVIERRNALPKAQAAPSCSSAESQPEAAAAAWSRPVGSVQMRPWWAGGRSWSDALEIWVLPLSVIFSVAMLALWLWLITR